MGTRLLLCVFEELANILFGSTHVFIENFGPIYYLGLSSIQHLPNLARN